MPTAERQLDLPMSVKLAAGGLRDRLRHDLGQVYAVEEFFEVLDRKHAVAYLCVEGLPEDSRLIGTEFHEVIDEFARSGPTAEELARYVSNSERWLDDYPEDAARLYLHLAARSLLEGSDPSSAEDSVAAARRLRPEGVRDRFAEAHRQSYLVADPPPGTLPERPQPGPSRPPPGIDYRRRARVRAGDQPKAMRVGEQGIAYRTDEHWYVIPIPEIELVSFDGSTITVFGSEIAFYFDSTLLRGSDIEAAIRRVVPDRVILPPPRNNQGQP
jgi:hypothetical protein